MMTDNDNGKGHSVSFLCILFFVYTEQLANVRWNKDISSIFNLKNGCRQGAVFSAIAYCFYVESMFKILKKKRSGCHS